MGNDASIPSNSGNVPVHQTVTENISPTGKEWPKGAKTNNQSEQIAALIQYAHTSYETNPTEALSALLRALTLNSGKASAEQALERIRNEMGTDVADHVNDHSGRMDRAMRVVQEMLEDESTILFESNRQHLLQQAMEDGSSVVCSKCNGCVPNERWQQHQKYWCSANEQDEGSDFDMDE
eukprot:CAMPEP_0172490450 /NCGR_PEP_ID=MMETSP1066-20121228/20874_1 /TAXON_ID=671091 /ORGANISM="Coscinodiscus wailesii, Strain CCMP2513" /LENGTH=179 /DNA_ID=CAMNT_0013258917 /DNA_START=143 /DNA_END=682 /DNA_ORIENTATION=-